MNGDSDSINNRCICKLGVNQKTGRIQWCPGLTCCKVLIIFPVVMLPLTLILVLLMRMDGVIHAFNLQENFDVEQMGDDFYWQSQVDEVERVQRCMSLKFGLTETQDIEEREIMKDARTSFIPTDSSAIPRECLEYSLQSLRSKRGLRHKYHIASIFQHDRPHAQKGDSSIEFRAIWKAEDSKEDILTVQAETMKKYMDTKVDPCVDFYKYACGNWEHINPIPKDKAGFDTFEMLRESLDVVLKQMLEEPLQKVDVTPLQNNYYSQEPIDESDIAAEDEQIVKARLRQRIIRRRNALETILNRYRRGMLTINNQPEPNRTHGRKRRLFPDSEEEDAEVKAKLLYQSCINIKQLEERGIEPLYDLIDQLGGWPVLDPNWSAQNFDWLNLTAQLRLFNNDVFLVQWVGPDLKNSNSNIIHFDQTSLGLPTRDYYLEDSNDKYLKAYKEFMKTVMIEVGASKLQATETADQLIAFETRLAAIVSPAEDRVNVTKLYKKFTLAELRDAVPDVDWNRYLQIVQDRKVPDDEHLVIFALDYMKQLVGLLTETETATVANYLMWRFIRHRINNVDDRFEAPKQKFFHALFGREESPSRWKVCIAQVNSNMGMALGAMFVRKYFDEKSKADTMAMAHEIQQAFREILHSTEWIDPHTKHLAEEKVNAMSLKIGYPDYILKSDQLNKKYQGIHIHPDKYFENTLNVLKHAALQEQNKMKETVNKTAWQTPPAIVNAYYSRNKNQIMFPAGILQPPFYHRHFPRSLNFGGIGVVIGHELTHGFDDKGRLFDSEGNIHKWWSDSAIKGFSERAQCLVSQYGNYTVTEVGIALNGESTQGENIADNGGIRQSFYAYQNWLRKSSDEEREGETLPGINMTGPQLFFLNFAQVWCGAMRLEATRNKLNTAIHSPGRFRVIGTLSNSDEFANEFQCESGTPMNPINKCGVW